jgi:UTP--glucose-1-phosphate uridylyltransferase
LGHAVLRAKAHVAGQSFAVLLGDDIIFPGENLLGRMLETHNALGAHVIALMEVPVEDIHLYGCAEVEKLDGPNLVRIKKLVEKPTPEDAPSNLAVIGRYVLGPGIFSALEKTTAGRGGEIQLTDALALEIDNVETNGVIGIVFRGSRFDTGDKLSYMKAAVTLATQSDEIGKQFAFWLADFMNKVN